MTRLHVLLVNVETLQVASQINYIVISCLINIHVYLMSCAFFIWLMTRQYVLLVNGETLSVTSHINCTVASCLINIVYLTACSFIIWLMMRLYVLVKGDFLSVTSHIKCIVAKLPDKYCLSHDMCLYKVMMTLHFLNDAAYDAESTQKSKITS